MHSSVDSVPAADKERIAEKERIDSPTESDRLAQMLQQIKTDALDSSETWVSEFDTHQHGE